MRRRFFSRGHLADVLEQLRGSYWLVPALMLVASAALAVGMVRLDYALQPGDNATRTWFNILQGDGARSILATVATGMASIAGTVFSIIIVVLQLASSQFGPHVLGSFMQDRGNQVSLGTFVSSFLYALLVILSVRDKSGFVPYAATYAGIVIAAAAMGVLVYFINHVAQFIRIENITSRLAGELRRATHSVFPQQLGQGEAVAREDVPERPAAFATARAVTAAGAGYVRRLDEATLMRLATERDVMLWITARPGDFLLHGAPMMEVAPAARADDELLDALRGCVVLGIRRTPNQDIAYALQQLCEVAVRALSPSLNAPYTALPCIDLLTEGLCRIAARRMPSLRRHDKGGRLRILVARRQTLADLAQGALGPIASVGRGNAEVMARLVGAARLLAGRAPDAADRAELSALAAAFMAEALAGLGSERERARVRAADGAPPP